MEEWKKSVELLSCAKKAELGEPETYPFMSDDDRDMKVARFRQWCTVNSIHYYADDRENFSMYTAYRQAFEAGARYLYAEDLS